MLGVNRSNRSNHDYLLWKIENHDLAKLRLNAIPEPERILFPTLVLSISLSATNLTTFRTDEAEDLSSLDPMPGVRRSRECVHLCSPWEMSRTVTGAALRECPGAVLRLPLRQSRRARAIGLVAVGHGGAW